MTEIFYIMFYLRFQSSEGLIMRVNNHHTIEILQNLKDFLYLDMQKMLITYLSVKPKCIKK